MFDLIAADLDGDGYFESGIDPFFNYDGTNTIYTDVDPYDGVWDPDVAWDAYIY